MTKSATSNSKIDMEEILDSISDSCYFLNSRMEFVFINRAAEEVMEKPREELLGKCIWDALPSYKATNVYELFIKAYKEQKVQHFEVMNDCSKVPVELKVSPNKDGILVCVNDISERIEKEREQRYYDRLKVIGEMAAGVAHEVRNPMTTVKGFLQVLAENKDLEKYDSIFKLMVEEVDRVNNIISEFLNLAKNKPVDLKDSNINELITVLYPLLETRALKEGKNITLELGSIPMIKVDKNELRQLLLNMLNNALDAMESGKTVAIITYEENSEVVLCIKDEGRGIPDDLLDDIATPFVTGKEHGTGLGLPICYTIAKRNNAEIDFSTSSKGTTFYIRFRI